MSPTPPGSSGGFFVRNLSRILVGALVGSLVGAFFALRSPAGFEASTAVLVTRLAVADLGENALDGTTPLDAEIRFAKSGTVRDAVRGAIPTAPNTIDVRASGDTNVLAFTAPGDTADEAMRLSQNWATAYIAERQNVLIASSTDRAATAEAELEALITQLGTARLAGDDAEAARLEGRRDTAAGEEAAATNSIQALQNDAGAELFGAAPAATETGRSLIAMAILGAVLGALLTGAWRRWREQQAEDEAEADSWLHQATEGSLELVMTAGMLDVPAFLTPGSDETSALLGDRAGTPATPPAPVVVPAPIAAPAPVAPQAPAAAPAPVAPPAPVAAPAPVAPATTIPSPRPAAPLPGQPRLVPAAVTPTSPSAPQQPAEPKPATRTAATVPKPAAQPLRIARIGNGITSTQRPVLNRSDQAWADDISLTTDR